MFIPCVVVCVALLCFILARSQLPTWYNKGEIKCNKNKHCSALRSPTPLPYFPSSSSSISSLLTPWQCHPSVPMPVTYTILLSPLYPFPPTPSSSPLPLFPHVTLPSPLLSPHTVRCGSFCQSDMHHTSLPSGQLRDNLRGWS